jgi:hypothetical protein
MERILAGARAAAIRNGHDIRLRTTAEGGAVASAGKSLDTRFAVADSGDELEVARKVPVDCAAS